MGKPEIDLENAFRSFMSILSTYNATLNEIQYKNVELRKRIDELEKEIYGREDDHT